VPRRVAHGTRRTDERVVSPASRCAAFVCAPLDDSGGAALPLVIARLMFNPLLTVGVEALYGSPLERERVETVPEIGR
jgi:hypothetical protein